MVRQLFLNSLITYLFIWIKNFTLAEKAYGMWHAFKVKTSHILSYIRFYREEYLCGNYCLKKTAQVVIVMIIDFLFFHLQLSILHQVTYRICM